MAFLRKSGENIEDNDSLISSEGQRDHLRRGTYLQGTYLQTRNLLTADCFYNRSSCRRKTKYPGYCILEKYFLGEY